MLTAIYIFWFWNSKNLSLIVFSLKPLIFNWLFLLFMPCTSSKMKLKKCLSSQLIIILVYRLSKRCVDERYIWQVFIDQIIRHILKILCGYIKDKISFERCDDVLGVINVFLNNFLDETERKLVGKSIWTLWWRIRCYNRLS